MKSSCCGGKVLFCIGNPPMYKYQVDAMKHGDMHTWTTSSNQHYLQCAECGYRTKGIVTQNRMLFGDESIGG